MRLHEGGGGSQVNPTVRIPPYVLDSALVLLKEHEPIYYISFSGGPHKYEAIIRPLSLRETDLIRSFVVDPVTGNDWIFKSCCLSLWKNGDQQDIETNFCSAGVPDVVADSVLKISTTQSNEESLELFNNYRKEMNTAENLMINMVCAVFKLLPDEVKSLPVTKLFELAARAEQILGRQIELEGGQRQQRGRRSLSPEAAAILSKEAADIPDPEADNKILNKFITGRERLGQFDDRPYPRRRRRPI